MIARTFAPGQITFGFYGLQFFHVYHEDQLAQRFKQPLYLSVQFIQYRGPQNVLCWLQVKSLGQRQCGPRCRTVNKSWLSPETAAWLSLTLIYGLFP